jgi:hypothetical protein
LAEFRYVSASLGAIAQLVERLLCKQDVVGSIPAGSTSFFGYALTADPLASPRGSERGAWAPTPGRACLVPKDVSFSRNIKVE